MASEPRPQPGARLPEPDRPWVMRTYAGHSSARASNELFRANLAKGQTGLSIAFDLPTQTGHDADEELATGEVGKVGVPVSTLDDLRSLLDGIPLDQSNTSMTINATAMWLFALYLTIAEEQGADPAKLAGTTQNDIIKEYLSRGTFAFPPEPSLLLQTDLITYAVEHVPRWNPINICSYHLQEAGATPVQEVAFALANAVEVLDRVRDSGQVTDQRFASVVGRVSFFVNAGMRFVEELVKLRVFARLWRRICEERYGVDDPLLTRFRYGVQVNSLGLTEQQPENNIARILIEMLGVTLARDTRARAVQLPAWNEALGLPRPWDQQLSLRLQQMLAYETDLLEHPDLFAGSEVIDAEVAALEQQAWELLTRIIDDGGAVVGLERMKAALVTSNAERLQAIESGEQVVVGVNAFTTSEPSPLGGTSADGNVLRVDPAVEAEQRDRLSRWRAARDEAAVAAALEQLGAAAREASQASRGTDRVNLMEPTLVCARAGATTGEWARALREVFGAERGPTGLDAAGFASPVTSETAVGRPAASGEDVPTRPPSSRSPSPASPSPVERVRAASSRLGRPIRVLVGKPGLDGHSNGAEQVALRARDLGMEVIYHGIRSTPAELVRTAVDEDVHVIGLSILSGSHLPLVTDILARLRAEGAEVPVIVGGIIPPEDIKQLRDAGVAEVFTPKDYQLSDSVARLAELAAEHAAPADDPAPSPGRASG